MEATLIDYTTVSTKGQVVLPKQIRDVLALTPGSQLVVMSDGDNILMKPVKQPSLSDFSALMDAAREWAAVVGMKESDINDAIKGVRTRKKASQ